MFSEPFSPPEDVLFVTDVFKKALELLDVGNISHLESLTSFFNRSVAIVGAFFDVDFDRAIYDQILLLLR